jgi:hypothetical protein
MIVAEAFMNITLLALDLQGEERTGFFSDYTLVQPALHCQQPTFVSSLQEQDPHDSFPLDYHLCTYRFFCFSL